MIDKFRANNHYVPKSYLNNWCNSNNVLLRYSLLVPHKNYPLWKSSSPKSICKHRHLYTSLINGNESDSIERWFDSEFESPAEESIKKAVTGHKLSPNDWRLLIRFLAAQDVRTPARMIEILNRGEKIVPEVTDNILKNLVEEFQELKATGNLPKPNRLDHSNLLPIKVETDFPPNQDVGTLKVETTVGRGYWLFSIKYLLENTIKHLLNHQWTILHSPKEIEWLTSDDPVVKLNYNSDTEYDYGGGWGSNGTEIFMPLSPKHLLYTRIGDKRPPRGTTLTMQQAFIFQRLIAEHAHRYIYSKSQNPLVNQLRPRKISLEMYDKEKEYWDNWHKQNIKAEQSL
jgi:hypothetical protein